MTDKGKERRGERREAERLKKGLKMTKKNREKKERRMIKRGKEDP